MQKATPAVSLYGFGDGNMGEIVLEVGRVWGDDELQ